jgi:double-strand break repair protein MRE11
VRIKVEYSGFDIIRIKQLESKFLGRVANEGEVLKFWRKQSPRKLEFRD